MHNMMELLKQIKKTKLLIPYEQLYIQSHHHHKLLIPEQNGGEYNPMYQLVYNQQSCCILQSHRTLTHTLKPNKPVSPQLATNS
jgi:hypothetical protein